MMGDDSSPSGKREEIRCSFCGQAQSEVLKVIAGPAVFICNECVSICNEILEDEGISGYVANNAEVDRQRAGGPNQRAENDLQCAICGRWQSEVAKLIAGPQTYICGGCVADVARAMAESKPQGRITDVIAKGAAVRCSFCEKASTEVRGMAGAGVTRMCNECLEVCEGILFNGKS